MLHDSGSPSPGVIFFVVDLGPRAAVGGMRKEINTGYSCYMTCGPKFLVSKSSQWPKFPVAQVHTAHKICSYTKDE